ncbi:anhydro-N-acetylmuramic acid kinase [Pedococcus cremeus]|uniref:Anhydro-N-acetylmuramic acid kinase n=1 Tax=Pedococcus cremeus TaxID=587636 RepID=A0A1H9WQY8_9MICO|nr:anhydro-N-acetylmuramic acid kinase [Pedococcus cremeus]SES36234.1 anhydro-N-acetylmuramic acid kinase [Pedococcus cremeus]
MRVLGMISGTSHDGIDVAICDFQWDGPGLRGRVELVDSVPYDDALRESLRTALPPAATTVDEVTRLDTRIGQAFAAAAEGALAAHAASGGGAVDAVCSHGQTVYHWVDDGAVLGTLQLGQPSWIAERTGLPVVADVRIADIVAGGQGAPLVPLLDTLVLAPFPDGEGTAAALNLGGISNVTVCAPGSDPLAWDIGPANALLDAVLTANASTPLTFDRDGEVSASGAVVPDLLEVFLAEPYYGIPAPKSTGKELFHAHYVDDVLASWGGTVSLPDLVATLVGLTARTVADGLREAGVARVFASGGGARNPTLMRALAAAAPGVRFATTAELGLDPDAKEAIAFALIGWATMHGIPGNVPSCTGAEGPRVLGAVTPAPGGGLLPVAGGTRPSWLVLENGLPA